MNKSVIEAGEKVRDTVWRSDLALKTTGVSIFSAIRHNTTTFTHSCSTPGITGDPSVLILPHPLPLTVAPGR